MKIAFMYAGQGAQKVGMGQDLYENNRIFRETLDRIDSDGTIKNLMFNGPIDELTKTSNTQPAMAAFACAVTNILYSYNIKPDYSAGLSLGEYGALYAAGVFDEETYIKALTFRGRAMEEASAGLSFKMSAILGLDSKVLEEVCSEVSKETGYVTVTNYNCTGQYVICGDEAAVNAAEALAKEKGAKRALPLKVGGPFHSKYMKPAGDKLKTFFDGIVFNEEQFPVIYNTKATPKSENEAIADILVEQVQNPIHVEETILYLKDQGVDTIIEIGPGKTICGFVKKTVEGMNAYAIEDVASLEEVICQMQS